MRTGGCVGGDHDTLVLAIFLELRLRKVRVHPFARNVSRQFRYPTDRE